MWVVKLGGSLADSNELPDWLHALAQTATIIVPGGGPFADAVRRAQERWRFDEPTAHDMAILAMHQYGRMLANLGGLGAASLLTDLVESARQDRAIVWLPLPETLNAAGVPPSWDITSDSLAAWLAGQLQASHLLLVKSSALGSGAGGNTRPTDAALCERLIEQGLIDPAFAEYGRQGGFQSWICGPDDHNRLAAELNAPGRHLTRIRHA